MGTWTAVEPLAPATDVVDGAGPLRVRRPDTGEQLLLWSVDGGHVATEAGCPHLGQPLADGERRDTSDGPVLVCDHHGYCFSLRDGALVAPVGGLADALELWPARVVDGRVEVDLASPA